MSDRAEREAATLLTQLSIAREALSEIIGLVVEDGADPMDVLLEAQRIAV